MGRRPVTGDYKWWQTGVIYQIYPRSFADTNGDGVGDLPGITAKLDYLSGTLGVDAVWLSPFYPSPMADFGYDVSDHTDVDQLFGTLPDFDRLVAEAHHRGIKVMVDYVINHTSDGHPWFRESRSSRDNPKRDWYVWREARQDGSPPNNWLAVFGGPAWERDEATGQYYLHSFLPEQPDLNWRTPEVEAAMFDVLRFWLDRGVDGFRIDAAHLVMKDPAFRDNPPGVGAQHLLYKPPTEYAKWDHLYDKGHPDIHPLFRRLRRVLEEYEAISPRFSVAEIHLFDWEEWAAYYGDLDALHMPYNFSLLMTGLDAGKIREAVEGLEAAIPAGAWPNWVFGNHDEARIATRLGREPSRLAALLLLTLRGTPTIYYGDELGMPEAAIPPDRQQDPWGVRMPGFGRDGCRSPMQWTTGPHAGFSPPDTPATWLPVAGQEQISVEAELDDPRSHLSLYRRLLDVRRASSALRVGSIRFLDTSEGLVYVRETEGDRRVVAANPSPEPISLPGAGGTIQASTRCDREGEEVKGDLSLRPWEGLVLGD